MPLADRLKKLRAEAPAESLRPPPVSGVGVMPEPLTPEQLDQQRRLREGVPFHGSDAPIEPVMSPIEFGILAAGTGGLGAGAARMLPTIPGAGFASGATALQGLAGGALSGAGSMAGFEAAADVLGGENPLPDLPAHLAFGAGGGAALHGAGRLAGNALARARGAARPAAPAPKPVAGGGAAPVAAPARAAETAAPAPAATPGAAPRQPFTGQSAQQEAPMFADVMQQIRSDPDYLKRLNALGGGRVVTNAETMQKALTAGPMTVDEIAKLPAGQAVNEVDVTRALITKDYIQRRGFAAMARGDEKAADEAFKTLGEIEPGIQNIRATPGRATQAQAAFVEDKAWKAYGDIAEMRKKGVPFDQITEAANKKLREVERLATAERYLRKILAPIRALETYATMAKLTSPITHLRNSVSNLLTFGTIRPLERAARAGALAAQGDLPGAEATVKNLFGSAGGLRDGAKRYIKTLMDDFPDYGKAAEGRRMNLDFPRPLRPFHPFRQLAAADAFWKGILQDSELRTMAYASARRQGLKGDALADRVTELLNDPPAAWRKKAEKAAAEHTFQEDPDRFASGVSSLVNRLPGGRLIVPFILTPYNLWKYQFQRSPLGVLSPRNVRGVAAGGEEAAEAFGRLAAGTGLALGAYAIAAQGDITGAYPKDEAERALWEAEGRRAFSMRVGNRWVNYGRYQPLGQYLTQAAALKDAIDAGEVDNAANLYGKLLLDSMNGMMEQPFLQGMSTMFDDFDDTDRYGERFGQVLVTGMVPAVSRDVRIQTDPVVREARGIGPAVTNMIPGLSQNLPAQTDVLGRTLEYDPNRLVRAAKDISTDRSTPETAAFREAGYTPPRQKSQVKIKVAGEDVALTGPEREAYEKEIGAEVALRTRRLISTEAFAKISQEQKAERIRRVTMKAREMVRDQWKRKLRKSGRAGGRKQ